MTYEDQPKMDSNYWAQRGVVEFVEIAAREEGLPAEEAAKRIRKAERVRGKREVNHVIALAAEGRLSTAGRFAQKAGKDLRRGFGQ